MGGFSLCVTCCWSHRVDFSEVIVSVELVFLSEEGPDVSLQGIIQSCRRGGSLDKTFHLNDRKNVLKKNEPVAK